MEENDDPWQDIVTVTINSFAFQEPNAICPEINCLQDHQAVMEELKLGGCCSRTSGQGENLPHKKVPCGVDFLTPAQQALIILEHP